jgi:hypothetical protein
MKSFKICFRNMLDYKVFSAITICSFTYKTELSWWIFALSGTITIGIVILTVSWQS